MSLLIAAFPGCSGPVPARREVVGKLVGNDGRPLPGVFVLINWSSSVQTDAEGRFSLRDVAPGSYSLRFMKGEVSLRGIPLAVRPAARPGGAVVQSEVAVTVQRAREPLDIGTWLAEERPSYFQRVHATFGPYCDQAFAGQPVALPPEALPLTLEWGATADSQWRHSEALASLPTAKVAAICLRKKETEVGRYDYAWGPKAYLLDWDIVVVTRDGKLLRKSFSEGPPLMAKGVRIGGTAVVTTEQEAKLKAQVGQWLRETL